MQKRFMPYVVRQIGLLCQNNSKDYLLLKGNKGQLGIPLIKLSTSSSVGEEINSYFKALNLHFDIKGIVEIQIGNNKVNNFYRWIYFIRAIEGQQNGESLAKFFKFEESTEALVETQAKDLIRKVQLNKKVWSTQLFRQNFKELAPRQKGLATEIDI